MRTPALPLFFFLLLLGMAGVLPLSGHAATVVTTTCNVQINAPTPECQDGVDNDGDGYIDYAGSDPSCTGGTDTSESPGSPKATLTCTIPSPCTISPGGSATLAWSSTGAPDFCKFADQGANVSGSGTRSVSPGATVIYDLFCAKGAETSSHVQATVTVRQPYTYIEATPDRVNAGQNSQISYSASQVTTCTMTGSDGYNSGAIAADPVTFTIATTSVNRTISKQTTFTITCDTSAATDSVIVNTTPQFREF